MFTTTDERFDRYRTAYLEMWKHAKYRPEAPGDGFGTLDLSREQLQDQARLEAEAHRFSLKFLRQDDAMDYPLGCPDFRANRAFVYLLEAARACCSANPFLAEDLIAMAKKELAAEYDEETRTRLRSV